MNKNDNSVNEDKTVKNESMENLQDTCLKTPSILLTTESKVLSVAEQNKLIYDDLWNDEKEFKDPTIVFDEKTGECYERRREIKEEVVTQPTKPVSIYTPKLQNQKKKPKLKQVIKKYNDDDDDDYYDDQYDHLYK